MTAWGLTASFDYLSGTTTPAQVGRSRRGRVITAAGSIPAHRRRKRRAADAARSSLPPPDQRAEFVRALGRVCVCIEYR